jgi:dienelactone hydrolase
MKAILYSAAVFLLVANVCQAQGSGSSEASGVRKVAADTAKGFDYPYYLHVPDSLRHSADSRKLQTILVLPNNSGKANDDLGFHESDVQRRIKNNAQVADGLGVAILTPVFPRPGGDWKIYTHALDRDSMTTDKKEYARFDLQLIAMIDDAREYLAKEGVRFDKKVFMLGFSASGMFVNRFTFLHPDRVKSAAVGSPGGWAIAPVGSYSGKSLPYPIGVGDLKSVAGKNLDLKKLRKVSMFFFLGDGDENDSVVFRDGYEQEDEQLIFETFGKTPVERWDDSREIYREAGLRVEFKLYPNVKHTISKEMFDDILKFFRDSLQATSK